MHRRSSSSMRSELVFGLLLTGALLLGTPALAYTSPGSPKGHVNDFAGLLSEGARTTIESELSLFNASTSNEIAVAIVPNMGGDYIENYAVRLFEEWGVGKKDRDNGVLLMLAIEEREMRIEVGYGLEGALPDSLAQRILDNEMTPLLQKGDYDGAVSAGVRAIEKATQGEYVGEGQGGVHNEFATQLFQNGWLIIILFFSALQWLAAILARSKSWWAGGILGFIGGTFVGWLISHSLLIVAPIALILTIMGLIFDYLVSHAYKGALSHGSTPPWWAGGSGGSSSGGFGGFGGGSSGGGGASGRW